MNIHLKILPLFLLLSCTRHDDPSPYEPFSLHPIWTDSTPDAFWDKQPAQEPDTNWNVDATIYF